MTSVAFVGRGHDLTAAFVPHLEHAVDRGGRQVGTVHEDDDGGLCLISEGVQPAAKRCATAAPPVWAVHRSHRALDLMGAEHDHDVLDRAGAHPLEHGLQEDRLLDVAEATRRTGGEDDSSR